MNAWEQSLFVSSLHLYKDALLGFTDVKEAVKLLYHNSVKDIPF